MEFLPNGYTLSVCAGAFPLSTDSMCLAHFLRLPKHARVLDLGSGCGTLGLLLCSRDSGCSITGLELSEAAHREALENIRRNALEARMESICCDLRSVSGRFSPGSFDICVSNPPYFTGGPASSTAPPSAAQSRRANRIGSLRTGTTSVISFISAVLHKFEDIARLALKRAAECLQRRKPHSLRLPRFQYRKIGRGNAYFLGKFERRHFSHGQHDI